MYSGRYGQLTGRHGLKDICVCLKVQKHAASSCLAFRAAAGQRETTGILVILHATHKHTGAFGIVTVSADFK
jgi:hypothetical protein